MAVDTLDIQRVNDRRDAVSGIILDLETNDNTLFKLVPYLKRIKRQMLQDGFSRSVTRGAIASFIEVFLFKKLVLKSHSSDQYLSTTRMPEHVVEQLISQHCSDALQNGVHVKVVDVEPGSDLHHWIESGFLKKVKNLFRGVIGYHAHIRFAANHADVDTQDWDDRYKTQHSNFHWDEQLNSYSTITYLTDVTRGDGEFQIIGQEHNFSPKLYLAAYDHYLTVLENAVTSNRVGDYLHVLPEHTITPIVGPKGTSVSFYGRRLLHDGGFPQKGRSRIALFLEQRNAFMRPIAKLSRALARLV